MLLRDGIVLAGVRDDTMVAAYLSDPSSDGTKLERIAKEMLSVELLTETKVRGKGKNATPLEAVTV